MTARILCVDDEPRVLAGLRLNLGMDYEVETAKCGLDALRLLREMEFDVIVADMRMPGIDGAELLATVYEQYPDIVRLLLTGHADADAARRAVNEGRIFRYLDKPCSSERLIETIEEALEVRRARRVEKELLSTTLRASIDVLSEVLAVVAPIVADRARRVRMLTSRVGPVMGVTEQWELDVAALLLELGAVSVPTQVIERAAAGQELSDSASALVASVPATSANMVRRIPRLEGAATLIAASRPRVPEPGTRGGQAALDLCQWLVQELERGRTWPGLTAHVRASLGPRVANALGTSPRHERRRIVAVCARDLRVGMVTCEAVETTAGQLVVKANTELTEPFVVRLMNFAANVGLVEPLRVALPD